MPASPAKPGDPLLVGGSIPRPAKIRDASAGYPPDAQRAGAAGIVTLDIVIDAAGNVTQAQLVRSVFKSLDDAALKTVRDWKYAPTRVNGVAVPVRMLVNLRFGPGPTPSTTEYLDLAQFYYTTQRYDEAATVLRQLLAQFQRFAALEATAVRPGPGSPCADGGQAAITMPALIRKVNAVYPLVAKASGIQGTVFVQAIITRTGTVDDVFVSRPVHPLLDQAALDAIRQWVYTPTLQCGLPVEVILTVTVAFTLQ